MLAAVFNIVRHWNPGYRVPQGGQLSSNAAASYLAVSEWLVPAVQPALFTAVH